MATLEADVGATFISYTQTASKSTPDRNVVDLVRERVLVSEHPTVLIAGSVPEKWVIGKPQTSRLIITVSKTVFPYQMLD